MRLLAITLVLVSQGCVYRVGPVVRDLRIVEGHLHARRCEIVYQGILGGSLAEERCHEDEVTDVSLDNAWGR